MSRQPTSVRRDRQLAQTWHVHPAEFELTGDLDNPLAGVRGVVSGTRAEIGVHALQQRPVADVLVRAPDLEETVEMGDSAWQLDADRGVTGPGPRLGFWNNGMSLMRFLPTVEEASRRVSSQ